MRIDQLEPGRCFEQGEEPPFRTGRLLRIGTGSAIVRFDVDPDSETTIVVRRGREVTKEVSFTTPVRPVAISLGTTVRPLERPGCDALTQEPPACALPVAPLEPEVVNEVQR